MTLFDFIFGIVFLFAGSRQACEVLMKAGAKKEAADKDGLRGTILLISHAHIACTYTHIHVPRTHMCSKASTESTHILARMHAHTRTHRKVLEKGVNRQDLKGMT